MFKMIKLVLLTSIIAISGCVPSLRGIANKKNTIYDEGLTGKWVNKEGDNTWIFAKQNKNEYKLQILEEDNKKSTFVAKLVKLDKIRFLDIFPGELKSNDIDYYKMHLLPVHTFVLTERTGDKLKLSLMDPGGTEELLKKNPKLIKHENVDDRLVLTASEKQLIEFLIKQSTNKKIFGEKLEYTKKPKPESKPKPKSETPK